MYLKVSVGADGTWPSPSDRRARAAWLTARCWSNAGDCIGEPGAARQRRVVVSPRGPPKFDVLATVYRLTATVCFACQDERYPSPTGPPRWLGMGGVEPLSARPSLRDQAGRINRGLRSDRRWSGARRSDRPTCSPGYVSSRAPPFFEKSSRPSHRASSQSSGPCGPLHTPMWWRWQDSNLLTIGSRFYQYVCFIGKGARPDRD